VSPEPGEDLKTIDVDTTALVSRPLDLPSSVPGAANLIDDRPGKISVKVDAPDRQLLVLSESYHTGWQVRIDSQPAALERVNGDFMGCGVPGGAHLVHFVFDPLCLRIGKVITLVSLAFTGFLLVAAIGNRPRLPLRNASFR
jgi:hypothetical protein